MAELLLKGAPVAAALNEKTAARVRALAEVGITPQLAIVRCGAREDDLAYERGALKRCAQLGIAVRSVVCPQEVAGAEFFQTLTALNRDAGVHGILLLRPLPPQLDEEAARKMIAPEKDVDGCTDASLAGVFTGADVGFPPCTAQAVVEILDHYGVCCRGKSAAVVGRSLVVGRPAAMLLLRKNATVTLCHSATADLPAAVRAADIVVVCTGRTEGLGAECFRAGQTVVDVGIGWSAEKQKLCGDVRFDEAEPLVAAITPVPGGVGAVTTSVLASHVVTAAARGAIKK